MSQADLDQWKTAAEALDPKAVLLGGMPLKDRVFEADGVAGTLRKLWEPSAELRLPGMKETAAQVPLTVAGEIESLCRAIRFVHTGWIAEARDIAQKLSSEGPPVAGQPADPKVDLRNRLVTLLDHRVSKVRRAARFVYRDHPEVVRQLTSSYERKRRVEAKRRKTAVVEPVG